MKKNRPTAVDLFRQTLSSEDDAELLELAKLPGTAITTVYEWLVGHGYRNSLTSVYNWHKQHRAIGAEAAKINAACEAFEGLQPEKMLNRIAVLCTNLLEMGLKEINLPGNPIEAQEHLRLLPSLCREIRGTVAAINQLQYISDRRLTELNGAHRMAVELRAIFAGSSFESALDEAISSALIKLGQDM
jgi:hypothetical protein